MVFSVAERIKIATIYMTLLQELFSNRIISRRSGFPWTPHSPDLCPLDFFKRHNTTFQLKRTVEQFVRSIRVQKCERVIQHFGARINRCLALRGGHIESIIVHR
ncbi:hypothetical protein C0J52_22354 [Blattella germanica]|nr:hypothetical protein C0J52_22354 [Blattella germanica]